MKIGGLQKFSVIDYPGKMAAVIFTQGCNFRCPWCHNRELALPAHYADPLPEDDVLEFLGRRVGLLEGVVVTGGEPTVQKDLIPFMARVKSLGFAVKLDTNGSNPVVLEKLLARKLVDYMAMDVKAPEDQYRCLAGVDVRVDNIRRSIALIKSSGIEYEFRTTLVKPLHGDPATAVASILAMIEPCHRFRLQRFVASEKVMDQSLCSQDHFSKTDLQILKERWEKTNEPVAV